MKNDPLPFHPDAVTAAEAFEEAAAQGKAFEMKDLLFARQEALDPAGLVEDARRLGLDLARFRAALEDHRHRAAIRADAEEARRLGVASTPAFFINGRPFQGAQPDEAFRSIVEDELARPPVETNR